LVKRLLKKIYISKKQRKEEYLRIFKGKAGLV